MQSVLTFWLLSGVTPIFGYGWLASSLVFNQTYNILYISIWIKSLGISQMTDPREPSFSLLKVMKGPSFFFSSQDLFSFSWFGSVNSITLILMHRNAHVLRTIVHSLLLVKVLSTSILFQKICGRESLDRALPSYLYAFASGSVMVTVIFRTGAFLAL